MEKQKDITITIGSRAFFEGMAGFHPKDSDTLVLQAAPCGYRFVRQLHTAGRCIYYWRLMAAGEYIDYALEKGPAMQLGKFLVPPFAGAVGLTISSLARLRPLVDRLDKTHAYERIIFEAYIANGSFTLTEGQRLAAFREYQAERA